MAAQSLMDWNSTRHPGNVTEDGVATLDDLIHYWGKTGQVCDFDIPDVILTSDAEHLMLAIHSYGNSRGSWHPPRAQSMSLQHTEAWRGQELCTLVF